MKLFFGPGACGLASQIALRESGLNFDLVKVDLKTKNYSGGNFRDINPKGYIPALQLDSGEMLTEGAVILQWIADQAPDKNLIPKWGTPQRYQAMEWLNYVATEFHKLSAQLFYPHLLNEEATKTVHEKLNARLALIDKNLENKKFMMGDEFTVVDAYTYNILHWSHPLKFDISKYTNIQNFMKAMTDRPSVVESVKAEGIRL